VAVRSGSRGPLLTERFQQHIIIMADQPADVINWDEAMQQVGEDEDFLRELLNDLRGELESQLNAVTAIIQVHTAVA
jgi:hypothetical protein